LVSIVVLPFSSAFAGRVAAWITEIAGIAIVWFVGTTAVAERVPISREPDATLDETRLGGDASDRIVPANSSAGGFEGVAAGTCGESRVVWATKCDEPAGCH
jgi:hypothetical protein